MFCRKQRAEAFQRVWRGNCYWSFGTGRSAGVAVLTSPNFSGSVQHFEFIVCFQFSKLNVVNIYAPNLVSDRKTLFERLHNYLIIYVIAGDFNCVDRVMDKFRSRYLSRSRSLSRCANRLPVDFRTS